MSARKRKRVEVEIPDSFVSHVKNELGIDFKEFLRVFEEKHGLDFTHQTTEFPHFMNQLIEEALRFIYLLADSLGKDTIIFPSYFVKLAVDCFALNKEEYRDICDALLTLSGRDSLTVPNRVVTYNSLDHLNTKSKINQLKKTLTIYKKILKQDPSFYIWNEYTSTNDAFINQIINVSINSADECHYYTIKRNETFTKIAKEYAIETEKEVDSLKFEYNSKEICINESSPLSLETYKNGCGNEVILNVI